MTKGIVKGYSDLPYVLLMDVPIRPTDSGPVISVSPEVIERRIAEEIIRQRVPLRGRELAFLRKAMGLSFEKLSEELGHNVMAIFHWENAPDKRIDHVTEAGLRSFFAEKLKIFIKGKFSSLIGEPEVPNEIKIDLKAA